LDADIFQRAERHFRLKHVPSSDDTIGIFIWHDAEGRLPIWEVPVIPEIASGKFYKSGQTWCHVNAHIQELPENGPDAAHLNVLHRSFVWDVVPSMMTHTWSAEWGQDAANPHLSRIKLTQGVAVLGYHIFGTNVLVDVNQVGPGIVRLHLHTAIGDVWVFEYVTPHKSSTQIVEHTMYCATTVPRALGKIFLWALEAQFQRDAPIWETKKYLPKPAISKADGPIIAFRRWYSQFYSSSSVSFPDALAQESMMDW